MFSGYPNNVFSQAHFFGRCIIFSGYAHNFFGVGDNFTGVPHHFLYRFTIFSETHPFLGAAQTFLDMRTIF
jgi:hypothetical protein